VIPSILGVLVALIAGPTIAVVGALPRAYIVAVAGLAILAAAQRALEASFAGSLKLGPMVAFVVAASSITAIGRSATIWALIAGLAASLAGERVSLLAYWRSSSCFGSSNCHE
jgi:benzoate membrane transport protein